MVLTETSNPRARTLAPARTDYDDEKIHLVDLRRRFADNFADERARQLSLRVVVARNVPTDLRQ